MSAPQPAVPTRFRFGLFEFDLRRGELRSNGRPVRLSPQPSRLLTLLLRRPGELITREEIRHHLWGDGTYVDFDSSLNFCMRQIRRALRDHGEAPRYIATLPRRGYRFIAPVELLHTNGDRPTREGTPETNSVGPFGPDTSAEAGSQDQGARPRITRYLIMAFMVALVVALSSLFVAHTPQLSGVPERIRIAVLPFEDLSAHPSEAGLGDSLTDELILQLSRMSAERFAVIARTSALAYRGSRKTVQQIARELDASYLVEATIRSSANGRVRIGVTLVRAADQSAIWADVWEQEAEALLPLQREVAARIMRALAVR